MALPGLSCWIFYNFSAAGFNCSAIFFSARLGKNNYIPEHYGNNAIFVCIPVFIQKE
jgi:hypothetical protein